MQASFFPALMMLGGNKPMVSVFWEKSNSKTAITDCANKKTTGER